MQDTRACLFCNKKLSNRNFPGQVFSGVFANFSERNCQADLGHTFKLIWNETHTCPAWLQITWRTSSNTVRAMIIDFAQGTSLIRCWRNNTPYDVKVERILVPDFPNLISLNEKVDLIILYS